MIKDNYLNLRSFKSYPLIGVQYEYHFNVSCRSFLYLMIDMYRETGGYTRAL